MTQLARALHSTCVFTLRSHEWGNRYKEAGQRPWVGTATMRRSQRANPSGLKALPSAVDHAFYRVLSVTLRSSPSLKQGWGDGLKSLPPDSLTLSSERARLWGTLPYCWALGRLSGSCGLTNQSVCFRIRKCCHLCLKVSWNSDLDTKKKKKGKDVMCNSPKVVRLGWLQLFQRGLLYPLRGWGLGHWKH